MLGWLFGIRELSGGKVSDIDISFAKITGAWHWFAVLVLFAASGVLVIWLYCREPGFISKKKKAFLAVLRILALWLGIFVLMGPVIKLEKTGATKTNVVVMIDQSLSMGIKDRRVDPVDILRAAKAMGLAEWDRNTFPGSARGKAENASRIELVEGILKNRSLKFLENLDARFHLHTYLFSAGIEPYIWKAVPKADTEKGRDIITARGVATEIGSSLRTIVEDFRGQPLGGIILFTDGGMNRGEDPLMTAEFAKNIGNPCFTVGVGLPVARDVQINYIFSDDIVFIEDEVPVYVRVRSSGYSGETSTIRIVLGDEESASMDITLHAGEETHLMHFTPKRAGEFKLIVKAEPREDELLLTNNVREKRIRVIDKKIKVLMIESDPRWEFRYIKNALVRDKRVELNVFLAGADTDYAQGSKIYLEDLPRQKQELFKYDVIVFGNIGKNQISSKTLEYIEEFVSSLGGGLLVLAGRYNTPWEYKETPLEQMLPVIFESRSRPDASSEIYRPYTKGFGIKLTSEGMTHTVTRLEIDRAENARIWREGAQHYWYAPVIRSKPAARVLVVHASERNSYGDIPVLALSRYGKGWVLWSGIDSFWRWRYEPGLKYFDRFWGQMIQNLSMVHILGESKRIQLGTDNTEYAVGDKVEVFARVLDRTYSPLVAQRLTAEVSTSSGKIPDLVLSGDPSRHGVFSGSFDPSQAGNYEIRLRNEGQEARVSFRVGKPQIEFNNPEMRQELLENIASITNGKFFHIDEVDLIFEEIEKKQKLVTEQFEDDLWDAPITIILFVLLLGTEVLLRKRSDLA